MDIFFEIKVNFLTLILASIFSLIAGYAIGYIVRKLFKESQIKDAEDLGRKIVKEAEREAQNKLKVAEISAKESHIQARANLEKENKAKLTEIRNKERSLIDKENLLHKESEDNKRKLDETKRIKQELTEKTSYLEREKERYRELINKEMNKLETISSYTSNQAKEEIKSMILEEAKMDAAREVKKIEDKAKTNAEEEARKIISIAVQRLASDHVAESSISVVELSNDEIKGRIIGREGRNIRALEQSTGIDLIIDDTPGTVILSGFDPIRREVARRSLEKLTKDGRIHPGRIEEVVDKSKKELKNFIEESGMQAVMDLGINNLHPDIVKLLGRLKFRTSYTQNVLEHVKEVSLVCGIMAGELGLDIQLAKRAGLLHDIGKAIDHQTDGTHTQLGVDIAQKYNEHPYVINSIASHHEDCEPESVYAVLVSAGDTISASRPGARREMLETYVKRMGQLEEIGDSYKGVQKTYAIQAGREVRIVVEPQGLNDQQASVLAKDVSKRIEKEVTYPGEIKITVLRETRYTEFAR